MLYYTIIDEDKLPNSIFESNNIVTTLYEYLGNILRIIQIIKEYVKSDNIIEEITKNKYILVRHKCLNIFINEKKIQFSEIPSILETIYTDKDDIQLMYNTILKICGKQHDFEQKKEPEQIEQIDKEKKRENEKEEEMKNIFKCDKKIYYDFKKKINNGKCKEENISSLFVEKYNIFKILDSEKILETDSEFEQYKFMVNDLKKMELYYEDKELYYKANADITSNKRTIESLPKEFINRYTIFKKMEMENLFDDDEYETFNKLLDEFC